MQSKDPGLLQMRKLFRISDRQLLQFLEYVPIKKKHLKVESPRIYQMIMFSGPQVEKMMVKVIELLSPKKIKDNFDDCYRHLNQNGMLEIQKIVTEEEGIFLSPFTDSNPTWWQAYNSDTKHRLPEGIEKATLENLLNMHGSLFILHYLSNLKHFVFGGQEEDPSIFLNKSNWIDLENNLKIDKPKMCWKFSDVHTTTPISYTEVMKNSTRISSEIFDYATVVRPMLIANVLDSG